MASVNIKQSPVKGLEKAAADIQLQLLSSLKLSLCIFHSDQHTNCPFPSSPVQWGNKTLYLKAPGSPLLASIFWGMYQSTLKRSFCYQPVRFTHMEPPKSTPDMGTLQLDWMKPARGILQNASWSRTHSSPGAIVLSHYSSYRNTLKLLSFYCQTAHRLCWIQMETMRDLLMNIVCL